MFHENIFSKDVDTDDVLDASVIAEALKTVTREP
jgi:hypothetical protein